MSTESVRSVLYERSFRAAIALNNSATTLLQQGNIRASMNALRAGLRLMKLSFKQGNGSRHGIEQLQQATEPPTVFSIQKTSHSRDVPPSGPTAPDFPNVRVEQVSSHEDPFSVLSALNDEEHRKVLPVILHCIAIENIGILDALVESADVNSAYLLYNYAIAQCSLASFYCPNVACAIEHTTMFKMLEGSFRLLTLCENIILPKLIYSSVEYQAPTILLLSLLVTHAMMEVARQLKDPVSEDRYRNRLACIATIIKAVQSITPRFHGAAAKA